MKSLLRSILVLLCLSSSAWAQVGFNNSNPDPTSILDLTAIDKGLLIPRLSTAQREAIQVSNTPGRSLLVFDKTEGKFFFYDGGLWYSLNEWVQVAGSNNVSLTGNVSVSGNIFVTGSITTNGTVTANNYALNSNGNGPVPVGGIIMWSGSLGSIPTGWALCDGTNNTPDLRERFIVGAGLGDNMTVSGTLEYSPDNTGGFNSITLTVNEIPMHNHSMSTAGSHQHSWNYNTEKDDSNSGSSYREFTKIPKTNSSDPNYTEFPMGFAGNHTHTINNSGGDQPHENRPPYYALAFIMKLP